MFQYTFTTGRVDCDEPFEKHQKTKEKVHEKPIANGYYLKPDIPNVLIIEYHERFRAGNDEWFVNAMMRTERIISDHFNSSEANESPINSKRPEKEFKKATQSWFCEQPFTPILLSSYRKVQECSL